MKKLITIILIGISISSCNYDRPERYDIGVDPNVATYINNDLVKIQRLTKSIPNGISRITTDSSVYVIAHDHHTCTLAIIKEQ